ncbi:TonB family protein, partial [Pseudoxanthomonas sp. SGD-10]
EDTSLNTKGQVAASNTTEDSTRHIEIPIIDEKLATIVESNETLKAVINEGENPLPTDIVVESFSPSMPTSSDDPSNQLSLNKAEPADKPSSMIARSATSIALSETTTAAAKDTTALTNGKVTDVATGMPLLGVVITDKKNGKSYLSNDKGEFSVPEQATSLSFYIPGYETKDVEIKNQTDLQNITLKTFTPVKEEVSLNVPRRKTTAGPKDGWAAFRKYLNINSELESGEIGFVVIEFVIRPNGELSNFKVLKSLSKLADARATDLIKNYQSWVGSPAGAHKVKVTVRFNSIAE